MKYTKTLLLTVAFFHALPLIAGPQFGSVIEFTHTRNGSTLDAFDQAVKQADLVIVDFYSHSCGPCKQLSPRLDELAKEAQKHDMGY